MKYIVSGEKVLLRKIKSKNVSLKKRTANLRAVHERGKVS